MSTVNPKHHSASLCENPMCILRILKRCGIASGNVSEIQRKPLGNALCFTNTLACVHICVGLEKVGNLENHKWVLAFETTNWSLKGERAAIEDNMKKGLSFEFVKSCMCRSDRVDVLHGVMRGIFVTDFLLIY